MPDLTGIAALIAAAVAVVVAIIAITRAGRAGREDISPLLREEFERSRQAGETQARAARQELADSQRAFQESTSRLFSDLSKTLADATTRQAEGGKALREEVTGSIQRLSDSLGKSAADQRQQQVEQFDGFAKVLRGSLNDFGTTSAERHQQAQQALVQGIETLRGEVTASLKASAESLTTVLGKIGETQRERLDAVGLQLGTLTERHEKGQEALRLTVEGRLDTLRQENTAKLDEMRRTVDEKLQSTLEQRLGESFNRVVEQLERVHKGIGEMQTLAAGVGDLKKVLSNVTVRGALGEIQLAILLEQFLSPEQLIKNAVVREDTTERVEFAVKLPGRGTDGEVLLPIDAKFPQEDYERLLTASHLGDTDAMAEAGKALENRIKLFAKTIRDKYIYPPRTTDFAILFLPTEGLYAEILRRPGLFEQIQRDYHVTIAGPTTLTAFLNALQMGFRSIAIEKRSSEVWQVLGAVRNEFGKLGKVVDTIGKQLSTAQNTVANLGTRTRAMSRKLREVETLPDADTQALLGLGDAAALDDEDESAAG